MLERATEVTEPHTQLLRVTLEVDNARVYWQRATNPPAVSAEQEAERAFVEFWFGTKSMQRLRNLIAAFRARFAVFPGALEALQAWPDMDRQTRVLVCHWHLQLSDPLYRRFTGDYLVERRQGGRGTVSRGPVLRWMGEVDVDERWSAATRAGFASKLLSAAHAAGLVDSVRDPRGLSLPRVPAAALGYLMYLLRSVQFAGSLHANPYLRSVGLEGGSVDDKLRAVAGLSCRRVGDLSDFTWDYESLADWVRHTRGSTA
jgi:hypothetical protein